MKRKPRDLFVADNTRIAVIAPPQYPDEVVDRRRWMKRCAFAEDAERRARLELQDVGGRKSQNCGGATSAWDETEESEAN